MSRDKFEDIVNTIKAADFLNRRQPEPEPEPECKKCNVILWVLAIIGAVVAIAGIAYAVYRYFTPDYLEDFEDDFDDDEFEEDDDSEDAASEDEEE